MIPKFKDPSRSRLNEFFATLQDKKENGPGDEVEPANVLFSSSV